MDNAHFEQRSFWYFITIMLVVNGNDQRTDECKRLRLTGLILFLNFKLHSDVLQTSVSVVSSSSIIVHPDEHCLVLDLSPPPQFTEQDDQVDHPPNDGPK